MPSCFSSVLHSSVPPSMMRVACLCCPPIISLVFQKRLFPVKITVWFNQFIKYGSCYRQWHLTRASSVLPRAHRNLCSSSITAPPSKSPIADLVLDGLSHFLALAQCPAFFNFFTLLYLTTSHFKNFLFYPTAKRPLALFIT